jgi:hypothetical protein
MEFRPRALGNRSIRFSAVGKEVKFRDRSTIPAVTQFDYSARRADRHRETNPVSINELISRCHRLIRSKASCARLDGTRVGGASPRGKLASRMSRRPMHAAIGFNENPTRLKNAPVNGIQEVGEISMIRKSHPFQRLIDRIKPRSEIARLLRQTAWEQGICARLEQKTRSLRRD